MSNKKRWFRLVSCLLIALLLAGNMQFTKAYAGETPAEVSVANGYYQIATALNEKQVLDVKSGSLENKANVQLWENHDAGQQRFYIKKLSNGYYTIKAFHSGKMLDVTGANPASKTNVQQYADNGNAAQQWKFRDAGNGYYYIQSRLGTYLDCKMGYSKNGTNVWAYNFNGANAQKWKLKKESGAVFIPTKTMSTNCWMKNCSISVKVSGDFGVKPSASWMKSFSYSNGKLNFRVDSNFGGARKGKITVKCGDDLQEITVNQSKYAKPLANGLYTVGSKLNTKQLLDVKSKSKENKANIQLWESTGNNNQKFQVTYVSNGYYKITNCNSGKSLDVSGKSKKSKTNLQQYTYVGNTAQLWRLHYAGKNTFYIQSKLGTYIDAKDGKSGNGNNVWMYDFNGSKAQQWVFGKTTKKVEPSKAKDPVKDRLDLIANGKLSRDSKTTMKVGSKFRGTRANEQCKGYARNVFYICFKVTAGSTKGKPNNHLLNGVSGMKCVATDSSLNSSSDAKNLFKNARTGDFVQMRRSHGGSHSAILYSKNADGVTFLEANTDNKNTVKKQSYSWKKLDSSNQKMSVYTATSYKLK